MENEYHKARRFTPFADHAKYSDHASLMLRLAIQHGFLSSDDYKAIDLSSLQATDITDALTPQQIQYILDKMAKGEVVDKQSALQATLHNPRVSKWMPGKGNWISKNKG